jgi:tetratricopeptide (TPR) repeat protein
MKLSCTLLSLVLLAGVAHADKRDKADALFKQGKKLMGEKRYADACEAFEKSYKLDPGLGAQLNIAKCYEDWGKLGKALTVYQEAEKAANEAKDPRAPKIHELVVALEPNVPHLMLKVPADHPASLKVTIDGKPVDTFNEPFVIDPGPRTIEWWVKGSKKKQKIVPIDRGAESEVSLDIPKEVEDGGGEQVVGSQIDTRIVTETPKHPGRSQRIAGIALGGAGVIAMGVSGYMTLSARSKYNDALDKYCGGMKNNCDMTGLEETHDARSTANTATIVFFAGVAAVAGGAALYFLAPDKAEQAEQPSAFYITPSIAPDGVGVVLGGEL